MAYPPVVIVDEHDNQVGLAMLKDAWAKALYYRVVAVLIEDEAGRVLLQKRAPGMELDPVKWDMSAGGHVDEGQTYDATAAYELREELGITGLQPQELGVEFYSYDMAGRHMNYFLKLYRVTLPAGTRFNSATKEVSDTRWFTRQELEELISGRPEQCARFLQEIYARSPALFASKPVAVGG